MQTQRLAGAHLAAAVVLAAGTGLLDLGAPARSDGFPWVTDVPAGLVATVAVVGALLCTSAIVLLRAWLGGRVPGPRMVAMTVIVVLGALVAAWGTLRSAASAPDYGVIPVSEALWSVVPVLLVGVIAGYRTTRTVTWTAGLLAAAPPVAIAAIGWGVQDGPAKALSAALLYQCVGTAVALWFAVALVNSRDGRAPAGT